MNSRGCFDRSGGRGIGDSEVHRRYLLARIGIFGVLELRTAFANKYRIPSRQSEMKGRERIRMDVKFDMLVNNVLQRFRIASIKHARRKNDF